ncbi:hypothetical protein [Listeria fleischmannii]|uniref:hypothetical protein n=1 Tax=Listeria fleischmannii TaxID=1069827 RepID=UPI000254F9C2|nr:hypothetical protein [Listeria fleischmannii]EIA21398.1 hypothetical protein KKC_01372 [Listeria fleischmannii subsp. coloradonensis]STY35278.1 Uncharacterised protein [Listeria fleischmannii subsp. coloradonensis]
MTIDLTGPIPTFILTVIYIYACILIIIAIQALVDELGFIETLLAPFITIGIICKWIWVYIITYIPYQLARKKATRLLGYKPTNGQDYYLLVGNLGIRAGSFKGSLAVLRLKNWELREEDKELYEERLKRSKGIRISKS